jgi:aminoglycoside phosphotransferase (APT) family kinase protein
MELTAEDLLARLAPWWSQQTGQEVRLCAAERIPGGASRQTWRIRAQGAEQGQSEYVLRLDPEASLIETDRAMEFAALRAFQGSPVPVPEPLWMMSDPALLGGPFFVMRAVLGGLAAPLRLMQPPYAAHHARMAERKWSVLGEVARADAPLEQVFGGAVRAGLVRERHELDTRPCWERELDHWQAMLEADALMPQPIQQAAIRWMRRHPPPPPQRLSVVHGDYRTGNLLYSPEGELLAVLDWEMVHQGDPLEDLAWGLNRVWCFQNDERRGGLAPREQAIAIWERASGLKADPVALHWWELLSCLKGQAIWLSAAKEYEQGRVDDSMMVTAAWMMINAQDRATLELLGRL